MNSQSKNRINFIEKSLTIFFTVLNKLIVNSNYGVIF